MPKLLKIYIILGFLYIITCNNSSDGFPDSIILHKFEFKGKTNDSLLIKWSKGNETQDNFFSYRLYGSNDSLMDDRTLISEIYNQLDTIYYLNINEPYNYFQIDIVNRLTGYDPIYFINSSNIIYFNVNEWVFLWDKYYSIFTIRLDLPDNELYVIPQDIVLLKDLKRLDLANNNLSGTIPDLIFELKDLEILILTNNQFEGEIPSKIDSLKNIETLFLNQNFLSGKIPDSFCNMGINFGNKYRFNIENNQFCPPYPACLESHIGEQDLSNCE